MLLDRYQDAIHDLAQKVETTQRENILKAGTLVAECVAKGGAVHLGPVAHKIEYDLLYRGGGPMFYKHFDYALTVDNPVRERDRSAVDQNIEGLGKYVLQASGALPGDILVVSSVSGRTPKVVDLAWEAKKFGLTVIAFQSMEYAKAVDPIHSSGKKLYEMADLTIDNCAPAADAMLTVDGIEAKFAAASGIASAYILWGITTVAIEKLQQLGITPGILKSANFPGGNDYNKQIVEPNYAKNGY
jgi:uncharacterized phosphosugar-binding protein